MREFLTLKVVMESEGGVVSVISNKVFVGVSLVDPPTLIDNVEMNINLGPGV